MVEALCFGLGVLLGGGGVRLFWPRVEVMEVEVETNVLAAREKPRFLLTWKRGRIASDDMGAVSRKIEELRARNDPYDYYMDGRQIHSGRWTRGE